MCHCGGSILSSDNLLQVQAGFNSVFKHTTQTRGKERPVKDESERSEEENELTQDRLHRNEKEVEKKENAVLIDRLEMTERAVAVAEADL
ncbi:hypothetical protein KIN20_017199 [Parelaphostrongylus tenuis]|uniref:Uncharacterized protein n=1 Tax=Parelaphostrongylus tenuis TaxID=148309 RepID=A0AAD5QQI5_PARTN|nr:hypothetical protein KIN20_017199 [Parelaphostrongylus tenuis]